MNTKGATGKELVHRSTKGDPTPLRKPGAIKAGFAAQTEDAGLKFNPNLDLGEILVKLNAAQQVGRHKPTRGVQPEFVVNAPSKAQQVGLGIKGLHKPKEAHSFKLDPDVYAGLKQLADRENRSVNNLAETLLWNAVRAELG